MASVLFRYLGVPLLTVLIAVVMVAFLSKLNVPDRAIDLALIALLFAINLTTYRLNRERHEERKQRIAMLAAGLSKTTRRLIGAVSLAIAILMGYLDTSVFNGVLRFDPNLTQLTSFFVVVLTFYWTMIGLCKLIKAMRGLE